MDIDAARVYLKTVMSDRFTDRTFERYIDETLAGDFAVEIATSVKGLDEEVTALTALCDGYRGEVERLKYWDSIVCPRCHGVGEITAISGQTPESYSEENIPCPDCVGPIIDERDAAVSALTRARAEGMEDERERCCRIVDEVASTYCGTIAGNQAAETIAAIRAKAAE